MTRVDNEAKARDKFASLFKSACPPECASSETGHHPDCDEWDPKASGAEESANETQLEIQAYEAAAKDAARTFRVQRRREEPKPERKRRKGWLFREMRAV